VTVPGPLGVALAASAAAVAGAQVLHWSLARAAGEPKAGGEVAVVVLGVPGTNPVLRAVQRWRAALAVETAGRVSARRVVFTGGPTRSGRSEAAELAGIACGIGLDPALVVLEERSRTTRENVVHAAGLVGDATTVVLVSDVLHASRARSYWERHAVPAPPLVLADRYRPFDRVAIRTVVTLVELLYRASPVAGRRNGL